MKASALAVKPLAAQRQLRKQMSAKRNLLKKVKNIVRRYGDRWVCAMCVHHCWCMNIQFLQRRWNSFAVHSFRVYIHFSSFSRFLLALVYRLQPYAWAWWLGILQYCYQNYSSQTVAWNLMWKSPVGLVKELRTWPVSTYILSIKRHYLTKVEDIVLITIVFLSSLPNRSFINNQTFSLKFNYKLRTQNRWDCGL